MTQLTLSFSTNALPNGKLEVGSWVTSARAIAVNVCAQATYRSMEGEQIDPVRLPHHASIVVSMQGAEVAAETLTVIMEMCQSFSKHLSSALSLAFAVSRRSTL